MAVEKGKLLGTLMKREFIHTRVFDRQWSEMGCNDDDLSVLQKAIADDPQAPPVIRGTGGVRKIRVTLGGRGKSGGARALYVDFPEYEIVYLLAAYPKNEKEDITESERKFLRESTYQLNQNWRSQK